MRAELQRDRRPPRRTDFQSLVRVRGQREASVFNKSDFRFGWNQNLHVSSPKSSNSGWNVSIYIYYYQLWGFYQILYLKILEGFVLFPWKHKNLRAICLMEKLKTTSRQFPQREQAMISGTFPSGKENKISNSENMVHSGPSWIDEFETFSNCCNWQTSGWVCRLKLEQTFLSPWLSFLHFFSFFHSCFSAFNLSGFSTSSSRQHDGIRVCVCVSHTHTRMVRKPLPDAILHFRIEAAQSRTRPRQTRDPPERLRLEDDVGLGCFIKHGS